MPPNIPKDCDWPKLQQAWYEGKKARNTNAKLGGVSQAASSSDLPIAPDPQATLLTHQKPKDKYDGHKEEEPKDKDDGHKEEDPKQKRALFWLSER